MKNEGTVRWFVNWVSVRNKSMSLRLYPSFVPIFLITPLLMSNGCGREGGAPPEIYTNAPAPMMSTGPGPEIVALKAAIATLVQKDSSEDRIELDERIKGVLERLNGLLNADPWRSQMLNEASQIASEAAELLPDDAGILAMFSEVRQDAIDYRSVYMGLTEDGRARFKENRPRVETEMYAIGDLFAGRFRITSIIGKRQVKMVDEKRGNRALVCELGFGPK